MLQADPTMAGVWLIIFDEFHERSLHADLGLALTLEVQQALRDDLRLLIMSATLDSVELISTIGDVEQISCAGRQHPVDIRWQGNNKDDVIVRVAATISTALSEEQGDVLVFMPGVAEIEKTARLIEPRLTDGQVLYRLHGGADAKIQRAATAPASAKQRRIILSTSIAETSITIDGVRVVIDAGLERRARVDSSTGAQRMETVKASQASATQRAGPESDHARRAVSWQAEILRADLSGLVMELCQWGAADAAAISWIEPPPEASIGRAQTLLSKLGVWKAGRLTEYGVAVSRIPVHPRLGHMLMWAAQHRVSKLACKLAVQLEEGQVRRHAVDLEILLQQPMPQHYKRRIAQIQKCISESRHGQTAQLRQTTNSPSLGVVLAQAYPDWIAKRRSQDEARYVLSCGAGASISADEPLARNTWLAVASMGGTSRELRIFLACALDIDELMAWSPEIFSSVKKLEWDDRSERVVAEQQKRLGSLVVESKSITEISDDEKAQALLDGIRKRGINCLPWNDECRQWQARGQKMSQLQLDNRRSNDLLSGDALTNDVAPRWPDVDDESLLNELENWLLVKLRYTDGDVPVLSVKLQEMFGCTENPSVANGKVVLKVELLSPARRPIQLTTDLVNFWSGSYPDVKKDMAGRYPKHDWPDDPANAKPTAYAKRRKS